VRNVSAAAIAIVAGSSSSNGTRRLVFYLRVSLVRMAAPVDVAVDAPGSPSAETDVLDASGVADVTAVVVDDDVDALVQSPLAPLASLAALRVLALNDNLLTGDDVAPLAHLHRLIALSLAGNKIATLASADLVDSGTQRAKWPHMRSLSLARNQLRALPDAIGALLSLVDLDVSGNALASLPPLTPLAHLVLLDIDSTTAQTLPPALPASLRRLTFASMTIDLTGARCVVTRHAGVPAASSLRRPVGA
jgi:hypothetical protein